MVRRRGHVKKPTVRFAGRFINISHLSTELGMDNGYVNRVLSGKRIPSVAYATRIAEALGLDYISFIKEVSFRRDYLVD